MSDAAKFDRMVQFARGLPRLRELLVADLRGPGLSLRRVLATVVRLLESTLIRVGNDEYARQNQSFGLTTLDGNHVAVDGAKLRFEFKGKSGKLWRLSVSDRRIARIIRECQELPGQRLFQYVDERGARLAITSADVNAYLRELSGQEITAKDFRTWAGTWRAATALAKAPTFKSAAEAKRIIRSVIGDVAVKLGNTPTVCRKSYVHPEVVAAFLRGELDLPSVADAERAQHELTVEEESVLAFLENVSTGRPVVIAAVMRHELRHETSK
jgi:DNA topoisomerase-1